MTRVRLFLLALLLPLSTASADDDAKRLTELDAYWAAVSTAVGSGDFAGYKATCHPDGVLVAGTKKACYPLAQALARWKSEFDATKAGTVKASVDFRFSQRLGDATTAHETGMFLYASTGADGKKNAEYIHLEAMLLKVDGKWLVMMEYQKSKGTKAEWDALATK